MVTQIVFLIDTEVSDSSDIKKSSICNSICLSCLRLLHLFSSASEKRGIVNKSKQSHTSVKWGYKFFSSKQARTKIQTHKLYDIKLKYFEEFENEIQRRFEQSSTSELVKVKSKASDSLSKSFTEVLADFQWEKPDITSPVKGRKYKKVISSHSNILFLFTTCPKNGVHLKKFTGKQVPDEDVLLDSLLPPRLFQEFCHVNKLTLNWIDTAFTDVSSSGNTDVSSVRIVEAAVAKAGGKVYPLEAVTQNGSPYFTYLSDLLEKTVPRENKDEDKTLGSDYSRSLLPVSSALQSLLPPKSFTTHTKQSVSLLVGDRQILITLHSSTLEKHVERFKVAENVDLTTLNKPDTQHDLYPSLSNLQAYGVLPKQSLNMETVGDRCYFCEETLQVERKPHKSKPQLLQSLISALATRQYLLILLCKDSGLLAILEPFTAQTATISVLSKGSSLSMEKTLMNQEINRVTSPRKSKSCEELFHRLLASKHISKETAECGTSVGKGVDGKVMDRWYVPGPGCSLQGLISKLNQRIAELDFLSSDEVSALKQLQKCYKQESRPPGLRETPVPPASATDPPKQEFDKFELPYKGKASRASLSRTDMILNKSKEVVKVRGQTEREDTHRDKPDKNKPEIAAQVSEFKDEEELKGYLAFTYDRIVSREITSIDSTVPTMITVALHYLKQTSLEDAEAKCQSLLEDCLLLSGTKLREKYNTAVDSTTVEQKIAEYQTQVLLRLEVMSTLVNKDQSIGEEDANEEIVGLLRTLSFIWEPGALSQFMQSSLIYNYMQTIPKTLANIYDELMQPLPDVLANLLSPDDDKTGLNTSGLSNDEFGPPSARTRSHGSVGPPSSQPPSNASVTMDTSLNRSRPGRKLVHHPSLADFGAKRQIVVQKVTKPKEEKSAKRKRHDSGKSRRDGVSKALFDTTKRGTKLERRQSVAVMERTRKTPKKMSKSKLLLKSPIHNRSSPRRKVVAETPCHRQLSQSMFLPSAALADQSVDDLDTTDVVEESPEKSCDRSTKDTPTKGKRAKALLRRSFYSAGPLKRTRNLTQYFQLADRIAGRQRHPSLSSENKPKKLLSFDADPQFKSPDKNSSFLLSQLVSSPSPAKTTPRKSTRTPSKLLVESPSLHTRSQASLTGANLFSPDSKRLGSLPRPLSSNFMSPVSRRQSPRVFVAESETKSQKDMSHTTPVKSPAVTTAPLALDSPSQNTRPKTAATPTRKSVRAALFAKSPAAHRKTQSPGRSVLSPSTLVSRFMSPSKSQTGERMCRMSPRRLLDTQTSLQFSPAKNVGKENIDKDLSAENTHVANSSDIKGGRFPQKSLVCSPVSRNKGSQDKVITQTTPSPHRKKPPKTPSSFDKWHRRKPISTQSSPAPNKLQQISQSTEPASCTNSDSLKAAQVSITVPNNKGVKDIAVSRLNILNSPGRKKRSLILSPEKPVESPSKRRRTSRLDSVLDSDRFSSFGSLRGSQGFDASSFNQSQTSTCSSIDYFSVTNDEVFLSQDSDNSSQQFNKTDLSKKLSTTDSITGVSPSRRIRSRLISEECNDTHRPESPTFGFSKHSQRSRNMSGCKDSASIDSDNSSAANSPPKLKRSPALRKFSPNVSAKSLMHLIQSPLLKSPISEKKDKISSPSRARSNKAREHTRRSLKLQN